MTKLWGGRFEKEMSSDVARFSSSLELDTRLWRADIRGSIAHAEMLGKQGIVSTAEAREIVAGLQAVAKDIEAAISSKRSLFLEEAEDVHSEIERLLREKIGPVAGKLHTARSRNDQVATACRLEIIETSQATRRAIRALQGVLVAISENETETMMPGLTHFQRAQPVSLAHHMMAYFWMLERDHGRFRDFDARASKMTLGSAALAGTSFPIDRQQTAQALGFQDISENSLDSVADRDFAIEFISASSIMAMHLSRLCEELIIWSAPEHGYVELDETVSTGSSIMPQKKNPDVAELVRGKSGRVFGALVGMLTVMKGLPLAYNRDMQEDKFHLFTAADAALDSLHMMKLCLESAVFNRKRMEETLRGDFSNATDFADDLAKKGLPFREAHEVTGRVVRYCLGMGKALEDLELKELQEFSTLADESTVAALKHRAVMNARTSEGGTSPSAVKVQLEKARKILDT